MVIYAAACEDCTFVFENACDATTHHVAERHAQAADHEIVYASYDERLRPFANDADALNDFQDWCDAIAKERD